MAEFEKALGRKAGDKHTRNVALIIRRVLDGCGLVAVGDLLTAGVAPKVEAFVHDLIDGDETGGMSAVNAAVVGKHARQFTRWLWRKRKALDNDPLAGVDLPSQVTVGGRRVQSPLTRDGQKYLKPAKKWYGRSVHGLRRSERRHACFPGVSDTITSRSRRNFRDFSLDATASGDLIAG